MSDNELKLPDSAEHQLVAVEAVDDCPCGGSHEQGEPLWGGNFDPREYEEFTANVRQIHDVELEYHHEPR